MEFDIGNILYVVITLVAIIASLLGKKKKPGQKKANPGFFENLEQALKMGQEDPSPVDLADHEPDLPEEDEDPEYGYVPGYNKPASEAPSVAPSEAPSMMEEYNKIQEDRLASALQSLSTEGEGANAPMEVIKLDDSAAPDYFDIIRDFDARTAVVYSAIINRPDY